MFVDHCNVPKYFMIASGADSSFGNRRKTSGEIVPGETGPKTFLVNFADTSSKEMLSMMDRVYLKLEAICIEADRNPSQLFQEANKYLENQMNMLGSNMRKLCAEIIRDLLPPFALNASGAIEADDNAAKLVEKELEEFHVRKHIQPSSTPHQHLVNDESLAERRALKDEKIGDKIQQPAVNKDIKLEATLRSKVECLSDASRGSEKQLLQSSNDTRSLLSTRSEPAFEIDEGLEQYGYWYVGSEDREELIWKMLDSISPLRQDYDKKEQGCDDPDSDWELL